MHRREPPAASPAPELQGRRHLAGADLCYPGSTFAAYFPARGNAGAGREGRKGTLGTGRGARREGPLKELTTRLAISLAWGLRVLGNVRQPASNSSGTYWMPCVPSTLTITTLGLNNPFANQA